MAFVFHQSPRHSYHKLGAFGDSKLSSEASGTARLRLVYFFINAIEDDMNSLFWYHVDSFEDIANVIAGSYVVGVVAEELNLFDDFPQLIGKSRVAGLLGFSEEVLDDVGVEGLVGDSMPGDGEVGEIPSTTMEKADTFGVDYVERLTGVLNLEFLPCESLVEVATGARRNWVES
ncbi:hypothetical protein M5K25_013740 [Dendrobium thyrsiflorum]|uniref:Uncharacterized protein n=1 Tax=Dendrobium thyrsiflorum TaxID=117978 RepID=A0ABD0UTU9_DENTH